MAIFFAESKLRLKTLRGSPLPCQATTHQAQVPSSKRLLTLCTSCICGNLVRTSRADTVPGSLPGESRREFMCKVLRSARSLYARSVVRGSYSSVPERPGTRRRAPSLSVNAARGPRLPPAPARQGRATERGRGLMWEHLVSRRSLSEPSDVGRSSNPVRRLRPARSNGPRDACSGPPPYRSETTAIGVGSEGFETR